MINEPCRQADNGAVIYILYVDRPVKAIGLNLYHLRDVCCKNMYLAIHIVLILWQFYYQESVHVRALDMILQYNTKIKANNNELIDLA